MVVQWCRASVIAVNGQSHREGVHISGQYSLRFVFPTQLNELIQFTHIVYPTVSNYILLFHLHRFSDVVVTLTSGYVTKIYVIGEETLPLIFTSGYPMVKYLTTSPFDSVSS